MSTDPTPPSALAEATARCFELAAELAATRTEATRLRQDLLRVEAVGVHHQRLADTARLLTQLAGHESAARALMAARASRPEGASWREHLESLAEAERTAAGALRPQVEERLGIPSKAGQ